MVQAKLTEAQKRFFVKQHYGIAGNHSAVKVCGWTRKSLHDKGVCYKQKFYGIHCHRCMQCTPVINWCNENCIFCWRLGKYQNPDLVGWDSPKEIVDNMISAQRKLLTGFPGGKINKTKWNEAQIPVQVAISLAGEPCIYPMLGELLEEFHSRNMTTFLVTNGTFPNVIENLRPLPTQFYVTLAAPDKETFEKTCAPIESNAWEKLNKTLNILPKLKTRKVIRLTLVNNLNMHSPEKYAELIEKANPDFVEVKAFMSVGSARKRLPYEAMPLHEEVVLFSKKILENLKMDLIDEQKESRVVLLGNKNTRRFIH